MIQEGNDWLYEFLSDVQLEQFYQKFRDDLQVTRLVHFEFVRKEDLERIGLAKPAVRRLLDHLEKCGGNYSRRQNFLKKLIQGTGTAVPVHKRLEDRTTQPTISHETKPTEQLTCLINESELTVGETLGHGSFGLVKRGKWTRKSDETLDVAIKILRADGLPRHAADLADFLKEVNMMHGLSHPNLIRLHGIVLTTSIKMMVTELAPLGALLNLLRTSDRQLLTLSRLLRFSTQIADGMNYLESKHLIHRDLAARNVFVSSQDRIKIGDFGLMRPLSNPDQHYVMSESQKVPFAWCAPESLRKRIFSHSTDTWMFGVTLWELFTSGEEPWPALNCSEILQRLDENSRLQKPPAAPADVYRLMLQCWLTNPLLRPTFVAIGQFLRSPTLSRTDGNDRSAGPFSLMAEMQTVYKPLQLSCRDPTEKRFNLAGAKCLKKRSVTPPCLKNVDDGAGVRGDGAGRAAVIVRAGSTHDLNASDNMPLIDLNDDLDKVPCRDVNVNVTSRHLAARPARPVSIAGGCSAGLARPLSSNELFVLDRSSTYSQLPEPLLELSVPRNTIYDPSGYQFPLSKKDDPFELKADVLKIIEQQGGQRRNSTTSQPSKPSQSSEPVRLEPPPRMPNRKAPAVPKNNSQLSLDSVSETSSVYRPVSPWKPLDRPANEQAQSLLNDLKAAMQRTMESTTSTVLTPMTSISNQPASSANNPSPKLDNTDTESLKTFYEGLPDSVYQYSNIPNGDNHVNASANANVDANCSASADPPVSQEQSPPTKTTTMSTNDLDLFGLPPADRIYSNIPNLTAMDDNQPEQPERTYDPVDLATNRTKAWRMAILRLKYIVRGTTDDECRRALAKTMLAGQINVDAAGQLLKIDKLEKLNLADRNQCERVLGLCGWDVERAANQLMK